jgi:hypothetical protein
LRFGAHLGADGEYSSNGDMRAMFTVKKLQEMQRKEWELAETISAQETKIAELEQIV